VLGDGYKGVENRILAAIHLRFGLPPTPPKPLAALAKAADRAAAFLEATHLAGFSHEEALRIFGRPAAMPANLEALLTPCEAEQAKTRFLARYDAIEQTMAVRGADNPSRVL
jgi:hypothetical protein